MPALPRSSPLRALSVAQQQLYNQHCRHLPTVYGGTQTHPFSQLARLGRQHDTSSQQPNLTGPRRRIGLTELGATRTVKITVLVFIGILGTVETVFWAQTLWRYFSPPPSQEPEGDANLK